MSGQDRIPKKRQSPRWQQPFLAGLREIGNVSHACAAARVARSTVYHFRNSHPDFAAAWDEALEEAADVLEEEAHRRAVDGLMRLKFDRRGRPLRHPLLCQCEHELAAHLPGPGCARAGCACTGFLGQPYFEMVYSDRLLIVLLKACRPARFCYHLNMTNEELDQVILKELARLVAAAQGGSPHAAAEREPGVAAPSSG